MDDNEFSPAEGRTILQGIRGLLDPTTLEDAEGEAGPSPESQDEQTGPRRGRAAADAEPKVEVVFKKGVSVDGVNEDDRDEALSEVGSRHGVST